MNALQGLDSMLGMKANKSFVDYRVFLPNLSQHNHRTWLAAVSHDRILHFPTACSRCKHAPPRSHGGRFVHTDLPAMELEMGSGMR